MGRSGFLPFRSFVRLGERDVGAASVVRHFSLGVGGFLSISTSLVTRCHLWQKWKKVLHTHSMLLCLQIRGKGSPLGDPETYRPEARGVPSLTVRSPCVQTVCDVIGEAELLSDTGGDW